MSEYPRSKFKLLLEIVETSEGKHTVHHDIEEIDTTMKEIGLALYKEKRAGLLDRRSSIKYGARVLAVNKSLNSSFVSCSHDLIIAELYNV